MHCRMFKKPKTNKLFQCILSLTYGHPVTSYVPGHNQSHHKYTQHPEDVMRTTKLRYSWHLLNGLFFQQSVAAAVLKNDFKYIAIQSVQNRIYFTQAIKEFWVVGLVTVALFAMDWQKCLLYYYVPHMFAQWGIVSINVIQHDGCDVVPAGEATSGHKVSNMNLSRNLTGWALNYFTMNNGYHSIHHFYPTMHWSHYKEAHEVMIKPYIHPNLDHESLVKYCYTTFISPGVRVRYDGGEIKELAQPEPADIEWIKYPKELPLEEVEKMIAPAKLTRTVAAAIILMPFKLISPLWSPQGSVL